MVLSRRKFLTYSLMTGLSLPLWRGGVPSVWAGVFCPDNIIDVHHHILPEVYTASLAGIGVTTANKAPFPSWEPQKSLDAMDRNGIRAAVTSISSPGIFFGDIKFTVDLARRCNDFSAGLAQDHPGRFGGFAVLPLPDIQAALRELEYALDILKLDGVVLLSNIGGRYLGDPGFDALYGELNRRKAVVFIHPTEPAQGRFPEMALPPSFFEFMFDTTRTVADLTRRDIPGQFPDIRFIVAHAGGAAPYLAWKMALTARISGGDGGRAISLLQQMYYDTALSTSRFPLKLLSQLAGTEQILFGSDFPFAPEFVTASGLYDLCHDTGFDAGMLKQITAANAEALFPGLGV